MAAVLLTAWVAAEVWLRHRSASWVLPTGQTVVVRGLGKGPRLACLGALALLGVSRLSLPQQVSGTPTPVRTPLPSGSTTATAPASPFAPTTPAPSRALGPQPPARVAASRISDLLVEARLTCTLNSGAQLPPGEVEFLPIGGGSDAKLQGAAGEQALRFGSPVRFREHAGSLTVINRFALPPGSDLHGRPVGALAAFAQLQVPIITVVYGNACARMRLLEITVRINGEDLWYRAWPYDVDFQQGPVFKVPLGELHGRLTGPP